MGRKEQDVEKYEVKLRRFLFAEEYVGAVTHLPTGEPCSNQRRKNAQQNVHLRFEIEQAGCRKGGLVSVEMSQVGLVGEGEGNLHSKLWCRSHGHRSHAHQLQRHRGRKIKGSKATKH